MYLAGRLHLRMRETLGTIGTLALQNHRIELTPHRVFQYSVLDAVQLITSVQNGVVDEGVFLRRNVAGIVLVNGLRDPNGLRRAARLSLRALARPPLDLIPALRSTLRQETISVKSYPGSSWYV